jgi:hypothetical protein
LEVKTEKERKERIKEEGAEHRNREGGENRNCKKKKYRKKKTHNREGAEPPSNSLEPAAPPR